MRVVVVYDISHTGKHGASRLVRVAKKCLVYGVRVQNSVYECDIDAAGFRALKTELLRLIDPDKDSIRFYLLGNHYQSHIETLGCKAVPWDRETYVL